MTLLVARIMGITTIIVTEPQTAIGSLPHMDLAPIHLARLVPVRIPSDFAAVLGHIEIAPLPDPISN